MVFFMCIKSRDTAELRWSLLAMLSSLLKDLTFRVFFGRITGLLKCISVLLEAVTCIFCGEKIFRACQVPVFTITEEEGKKTPDWRKLDFILANMEEDTRLHICIICTINSEKVKHQCEESKPTQGNVG